MTIEDRYEQSLELLNRVHGFHIDRLELIKSLDKKQLVGYNKVMVDIYEFLQDKPKGRKDIYGG